MVQLLACYLDLGLVDAQDVHLPDKLNELHVTNFLFNFSTTSLLKVRYFMSILA